MKSNLVIVSIFATIFAVQSASLPYGGNQGEENRHELIRELRKAGEKIQEFNSNHSPSQHLQRGNSIQKTENSRTKRCSRVYLGLGSENHDTIVASPHRNSYKNRELESRMDAETEEILKMGRDSSASSSEEEITDKTDKSRWSPVGFFDNPVMLDLLKKFTGVQKEHEVDRAIVLMKSKAPIAIHKDFEKYTTEVKFIKKLAADMTKEEEATGKPALNIGDIQALLNKIYNNSLQTFEAAQQQNETETATATSTVENATDPVVGCSKEKTETESFYPMPSSSYRSHEQQKPHGSSLIVQPPQFDQYTSSEEVSGKRAKNPKLLEDAPRSALRNRQELLDSVSQKLSQLEQNNENNNMMVGSSNDEEIENANSRTNHYKDKKNKKGGKGGGYHSTGYGYNRAADPENDEINKMISNQKEQNSRSDLDMDEQEIPSGIGKEFNSKGDQAPMVGSVFNPENNINLQMTQKNSEEIRDYAPHEFQNTQPDQYDEETPMDTMNSNVVGSPDMLPEEDVPSFTTAKPPTTPVKGRSSVSAAAFGTGAAQPSQIQSRTSELSENDINVENIEKLMTPQEQEFLQNFGKIVPAAEKMALNTNTDVFFMGNGIKLPLKVAQNEDGTISLSVDIEKLCKCKNATCIHTKEMMKQLNHELAGIASSSPSSSSQRSEENAGFPVSTSGRSRKARHHQLRRHRRLHKRSIGNAAKYSYTGNALIKENSDNDLQKFQNIEKELEMKLERLHEDVKKTNKQYDDLVQKGTKDLLQIKSEDQVVKHRIELVNDLLKWMREMADGIINNNNNNAEKKTETLN